MQFKLPKYRVPDFTSTAFTSAPDVTVEPAPLDSAAPENFHATSIYPEYFKVAGTWKLAPVSRMDCVVVIEDDTLLVKEMRRLRKGELVVVGRDDDISQGVYVHSEPFEGDSKEQTDPFFFRSSRSRETPMSRDYECLEALLEYESEDDHGHICWVLGPAVVFDYYSRQVMAGLIEAGYVHSILAGNAVATHDLEGALFGTALGNDIRTNVPTSGGHYCHIDLINKVRNCGSIGAFIKKYDIKEGIMAACTRQMIPYVLAGSIRDDGPLPEVYPDVYAAQDAMRSITDKATTVICMATQLHSIATGNMTACFRKTGDAIRPVYFYIVDTAEFASNKLRDRGSLSAISITTNVHDFLGNLSRRLL
ncbi:MAG TPA: hypothetical protein PKZ09_03870 [Bacillota bacterium]|nr:hypothetical protein [Bacillota bacterium]